MLIIGIVIMLEILVDFNFGILMILKILDYLNKIIFNPLVGVYKLRPIIQYLLYLYIVKQPQIKS
jgi:hypothetical protein